MLKLRTNLAEKWSAGLQNTAECLESRVSAAKSTAGLYAVLLNDWTLQQPGHVVAPAELVHYLRFTACSCSSHTKTWQDVTWSNRYNLDGSEMGLDLVMAIT
jgi:hypothetical protein